LRATSAFIGNPCTRIFQGIAAWFVVMAERLCETMVCFYCKLQQLLVWPCQEQRGSGLTPPYRCWTFPFLLTQWGRPRVARSLEIFSRKFFRF